MIEKIKGYALAALGGIVLLLSTLVYALFSANKKKEAELGGLRGELLLKDQQSEIKEAEHEANTSEDAYSKLLNEYKNANKSGDNK